MGSLDNGTCSVIDANSALLAAPTAAASTSQEKPQKVIGKTEGVVTEVVNSADEIAKPDATSAGAKASTIPLDVEEETSEKADSDKDANDQSLVLRAIDDSDEEDNVDDDDDDEGEAGKKKRKISKKEKKEKKQPGCWTHFMDFYKKKGTQAIVVTMCACVSAWVVP